jgi:hypothetical protein
MHRPARIEGLVYASRVIQVNYPLTVVHGKYIVSRSFFFSGFPSFRCVCVTFAELYGDR